MSKIIKQLKREPIECTCPRCHTVFEADNTDVFFKKSFLIVEYGCIKCPTCKTDLFIDNKHLERFGYYRGVRDD